MDQFSKTRLSWRGQETVRAAADAVRRGVSVEFMLPHDFHHTLFSRLHPGSHANRVEQVDVTGAAELLSRIAEIRGLQVIAELADPVSRTGSSVRIVSPPPRVIIIPA